MIRAVGVPVALQVADAGFKLVDHAEVVIVADDSGIGSVEAALDGGGRRSLSRTAERRTPTRLRVRAMEKKAMAAVIANRG